MKTGFACCAAALLFAGPAIAQDRAIVVLDASGSMWGQIDGRSKIEIARDTLAEVLGTLPADREVGLIAYGHRTKGDCADIELVVPPAAGTGAAIADAAKGLNPKGKTPLSDAVRQAAEALRYTEDKATVVLVTDGLETCDADPCALAAELESTGVDFTAHVVGFGLTEDEGAEVACLAEETGGRYLQAGDGGALTEALRETVVAAAPPPEPEPQPQPEPLPPAENLVVTMALCESCDDLTDEAAPRWDIYPSVPEAKNGLGEQIAGGYDALIKRNLAAGDYVLISALNGMPRRMPFTVTDGDATELHIDWDAGVVALRAVTTAGAADDLQGARLDLENGGWDGGGYTTYEGFVPAGQVAVAGRMGKATTSETLTVTAGERLEHEVVIASGWVTPVVVYAEGGPVVEDNGMRYDILPAAGGDAVNGGYGPGDRTDVPAGSVIVAIRLGQATAKSAPVDVPAGSTVEVPVTLNAGVLAIAAPGADRIDILAARKKINGDRDGFGGGYGAEYQDTLHAGDYLIHVSYPGDLPAKEVPASVAAGERTEISVE